MSVVVTIGGVPFATPSFSWTETYGVRPESRVVEVPGVPPGQSVTRDDLENNRAAQILGLGLGPHQLTIHVPGKRAEVWERIYVLHAVAGSQPNTTGIFLADERWLWDRPLIARSLNVRRRTGRRVLLPGRKDVAPRIDDERYAPWSLDGTQTFSAARAMESALAEVARYVGDQVGSAPPVRILAQDRQLPIEDLEPLGSGTTAVAQILQYLPGWALRLGRDGAYEVVDKLDRSEVEVLARLQNKIQDGTGSAVVVDKSRIRPRRVVVHFVREIELRLDHVEDSQPTQVRNREPLLIENVAPLADFALAVDGQEAAQGEWHRIGDNSALRGGLLYAYNQDANNPRSGLTAFAAAHPLSLDLLRKHYFPGHEHMLNGYSLQANGAPDEVWARRIATIRAHFRRTFRVSSAWRDKLRSIRAYRVGIVHPATGSRAPATVYTDWVTIPSLKGALRREGQRLDKGWVLSGYADDLANATVSPFVVQILDGDLMVFQVLPVVDPWGESNAVVAGSVSNPPTYDLRKLSKLSDAGEVYALWYQTQLDAGWKLSVVLTGVPAAPNNAGRFHARAVEAAEVGDSNAQGPDYHVLIGEGLMTAMFGWRDDQADAIRESFFTGSAVPDELLVNRDQVDEVAKAAARRVYALYRDQVEGAFGVMIGHNETPQGPTGNLQAITHVVASDDNGQTVATSYLQLPPVMEAPDLLAYLPQSYLRTAARLAQP